MDLFLKNKYLHQFFLHSLLKTKAYYLYHISQTVEKNIYIYTFIIFPILQSNRNMLSLIKISQFN